MNRTPSPNHVALLVRSAERTASYLRNLGFQTGPAEEWDGEGTLEIYVEREKGNSLLLMQPVKPGAYQRAMEKRGPGLHHLAIDVQSLEEFFISISSSGWLLHPTSIRTIQKTRTAYLARPGFPALIEVQEKPEMKMAPIFVESLGLRFSRDLSGLAPAIGLSNVTSCEDEPWISCGGQKFNISSLCLGDSWRV
jgi:hypothetical protein